MAEGITVAATIAAGAMQAGALAQQALDSAQQMLVDKWLQDSTTTLGAVKHISSILAQEIVVSNSAALAGTPATLNSVKRVINSFTANPEVAKFMNDTFDMFRQPNIEGITIFTQQETTTRQMDISEHPLVVQSQTGSTTYTTDNAVPHPREWQLKGHITSVLPTDHYFVLKPSLMFQRQYLDNCMKSRRPVWFKTYDNLFVPVLISNFQSDWESRSMNSLSVDITLKEFVPITVTEGPITAALAKFVKKFGSALL